MTLNSRFGERNATPVAVDLFSGSGSVTAALKRAGYWVAAGLDVDEHAAATYRANHPEVHLFRDDIHDVEPDDLAALLPKEGLDLLTICAPCQPFSSQNRKRRKDDDRASLILQALPFIEALRPRTIWVENVPGLGSSKIIRRLKTNLASLGYHFEEPMRLDAADFCVPQRRIRFVFTASIDRRVCSTLAGLSKISKAQPTVRMAFEGLKSLGPFEFDEHDRLHASRRHGEMTLKRLKHIPGDGGSRTSLPPELQLVCHRSLPSGSFPDVYGRMSWDAPAPTLTTGCTDVTRGRFAHPEENRAITLREAARLQTFPDDYEFCGTRSDIAAQIGNAVPMAMAYAMFEQIHGCTRSWTSD
ncbi:DNA cytosine methyltransferase [Spectribacter hydrogenoxidans]|uniref:Cytosine-specific methyltransferase n=1 Tax=Spectribacter hydrogenoxidans TaxID=3075608 RepID=A0ABU3BWJ5_9GAMM|nr:DNA cytosine methyltransferase [Salinisphaera sp. W335]MDT0633640.1 DNA cytosine methyltransferase [Salinisphaera sp. W335]